MRRACSDWRFVAALAATVFSALLVAVVVYLPRHRDHATPTPTATRTAHPVRTTHRHPTVDGPAPHPAFTPAPEPQQTTQHPTTQRPSHKPSPHPTHQPTRPPKPTPRPSPSPTCVLGVVCL